MRLGLACALLLAAAGCSGETPAATGACGVPGLVRSCDCSKGEGTQSCSLDGEWDACECNTASTGTAGTGNGNGQAGAAGTDTGVGSTAGSGGVAGIMAASDGGMPIPDVDASQGAAGSEASDASVPSTLYARCTSDTECTGDGQKCDKSGGGGGGFGTGGGTVGGNGYCTTICTQNADCPAASTGTATASCNNSKCQLVCSTLLMCPTGLACLNFGPAGLCI